MFQWNDVSADVVFCVLQVIGSGHEYHFIQRALPHARTKRSVLHTRQLKTDPSVSSSLTTNSRRILCHRCREL